MYKSVLILYLTIFGLYILFTRQPDFFDGEKTPAKVHFVYDTTSKTNKAYAIFNIVNKTYQVPIDTLFNSVLENESVTVIYESENPNKAKMYTFYGYWITWQELVASIILCIVLFQIAVGITNNPTPEAVLEQLTDIPKKKRKYTD
ncbi:MAG: hypothetical protein ACOVNY_07460 [Chitinophagaceae bacterium]